MFEKLEGKLNNIENRAERSEDFGKANSELLHDTKYWVTQAYNMVCAWGFFAWMHLVLLLVIIVMSGISCYHTKELRKQVGVIQAQTERSSGTGSKDSGCNCQVPQTP